MLEGDKCYEQKQKLNKEYLEGSMGMNELQLNVMVNLLNSINYNGN